MSNLKQIGLGMMMYVQDYDGTYPAIYADIGVTGQPGGNWGPTGKPTRWFWQQQLYPYTKSLQVYVCPSQVDTGKSVWLGQYGVNSNIIRSQTDQIKIAAVNSPASTYMCMDSGAYYINASRTLDPEYQLYFPGVGDILNITPPAHGTSPLPTNTELFSDFSSGRHFHGVNVAFADGHVKWLKSRTMIAEAKKPGDGNWNRNN